MHISILFPIGALLLFNSLRSHGQPSPDLIPEKINKGEVRIELQPVIPSGLISPLGLEAPNDGSDRLFVYDQVGLVWTVNLSTGATNILLDVRNRLVPLMPGYDERGLIGFALHPGFATNGLVYTYTTESVAGTGDFTLPKPADKQFDHQNVLAEWRIATTDANQVDLGSRREILRIDQPQFNHNGGSIRFGPDGFLYFGLGDGGGADDQDGQAFLGDVVWGHGPTGNGQNIETVHGSLLRIDVNGRNSANGRYGIPSDNPFVGAAGVDEIFAYGLRNPYSFSFDRETGRIYLGDAGQNHIEEINGVLKGGNLGWNIKEGSFFFEPNGTAPGYATNVPSRAVPSNLVEPVAEFDHDEGRVVIGGFVYRGTNYPALRGVYLASDFIMQNEPHTRLLYFNTAETNFTSRTAFREIKIGLEDRRPEILVKGFGEDANGELYIVGSNEVGPIGTSGKVFKIVPLPQEIAITNTARSGTNVVVSWSGGVGPFGVEQKVNLTDLLWNIPQVASNRQATLPADAPSAFLRIAEKPHVVTTAFSASLSGAHENPAVATGGTGLGLFLLEENSLSYFVVYSNLTSSATAAHIHGPAGPDANAPVLLGLQPFGGPLGQTGVLAGSARLADSQKLALLNGESYVNIHTTNAPGGEIRGHLVPAALASPLRGAWERPKPVDTPAIGNALLALLGNKLTFVINYTGLLSPSTFAHIHGPAGHEEVAPPMVDLTPFMLNKGTNGTIAGSVTLTDEQLRAVAGAKAYINVHTEAFPGGEIRGHIFLVPGVIPMTVYFSGAVERPAPVTSPGGGLGILAVAGNRVLFEMMYTNISGTPIASHIHGPAMVNEVAPPVVSLTPFTVATSSGNGFISGAADLPMPVAVDVLNGRTYVNVHTSAHQGGEIRSQIAPVLTKASLSGQAERPHSVSTPGTGAGVFVLLGNELNIHSGFANLSAPASAAHIHGPASLGITAGVLVPLNVPPAPAGVILQKHALSVEHWNHVVSGLTYLNVHTTNNPPGEIRGQILP